MKVGFFFILLMALWSIEPMLDYVFAMQLPKWLAGVLFIIAFVLWFCGLTFMYHAEKAVFKKNNDERG